VFSVPIRTAVVDPAQSTYEYGAGAGITWSSEPHAEDTEVRAKARILTRSHRDLALLETLRLDAHGIANAGPHIERMAGSARWFGIPFDADALASTLCGLEPTGRVERIRVLLAFDGTFTVERHPFVPTVGIVRLAIDDVVTRSDDPFCCHKTTWRRHYDDARGRHPDADDVVLVNELGHAIETTIANLAYELDGRWWCPPLQDGGLDGIARRLALADGRLVERSIPATDLRACTGLAVLNDLRGWRRATLDTRPSDHARD
jgi:para-aminobenzoate synthetase/4-amino-4-deoxychorismate lyase